MIKYIIYHRACRVSEVICYNVEWISAFPVKCIHHCGTAVKKFVLINFHLDCLVLPNINCVYKQVMDNFFL